MHLTAMMNAKRFFDTYVTRLSNPVIVEIGSQDVNGSLRDVAPANAQYTGLDFVEGKGVDVVLTDPYHLPLETESVDVVVSSSCFEHSEMFWLVFLEVLRILKPGGLFYLNAPSNGVFHRYPVDCWRFYPDSGGALVTWAKREGMNPALLESYVSAQYGDTWNDFVAVFVKDAAHASDHPLRVLSAFTEFENAKVLGHDQLLNPMTKPEDIRRSMVLTDLARQLHDVTTQNELRRRANVHKRLGWILKRPKVRAGP
jgi:SAM-dependent methyltransferase